MPKDGNRYLVLLSEATWKTKHSTYFSEIQKAAMIRHFWTYIFGTM